MPTTSLTTFDWRKEFLDFTQALVSGSPAPETYDRIAAVLANSLAELQSAKGILTQQRIEAHRKQTTIYVQKLALTEPSKDGPKPISATKAETLSKDTDEQRAVDKLDGELALVDGQIEGATACAMALGSIRKSSNTESRLQ